MKSCGKDGCPFDCDTLYLTARNVKHQQMTLQNIGIATGKSFSTI